jgi:periplasmic protein CpxP/Spy
MSNRAMNPTYVALTYVVILVLGMAGPAVAQDNEAQKPSAREQPQHVHTPRSIDRELTHLTKDLELSPKQQQLVRPLLQEHQDKIQALLDKNPKASRRELAPQIHSISDETHRQIHALLTDRQKELEKSMQEREHKEQQNRRPDPPAGSESEPSSLARDLSDRCCAVSYS